MKICVFTTDIIPLPGVPTSGTALRTFGLIQGLKSHGHEVSISVPKSALEGMKNKIDLSSLPEETQKIISDLETLAFDSSNQSYIVTQLKPDVILCGHWPAITFTNKPSQILIVDLAGPHLLERHFQGTPNHIGAVLGKINALAKADYFIASGEKQRLYFLSFLLRAGIKDAEKRFFNITMPLSPELPQHLGSIENNFPSFVFGGVFLPWQNPSFALTETCQKIASKGAGNFTLIGGSHPNYQIDSGIYENLFANLKRHDFVTQEPMLPLEKFIDKLKMSDVAIDLMEWNLERELALTIRSTTYLWSGVPIIYNNYADLAQLLTKYDAGWCVPANDREALNSVLEEIYQNKALVKQKSLNAQRLAREVFSWDIAVKPVINSLLSPYQSRREEIDIMLDCQRNSEVEEINTNILRQKFTSRINGLSKIEIKVAPNSDSEADLKFSLSAQSAEGSSLVHSKVYRQSEVLKDGWVVFNFPTVADSAGKNFAIEIQSIGNNSSSSFIPMTLNTKPYPLAEFFIGQKEIKNHSLCLKTFCSTNYVS
ncbi:MAG: hypothetical protein KBC84_01190 [Proteobacteria bacterium]|nr:hypothetical protein [Pseudomonadota bacterium]